MPMAAARPCPTCRTIGCTIHRRTAWTQQTPTPRMRGRALQLARYSLFQEQPWCVTCLAKGLKTVATIRDHIIPLAEGGADNYVNTQGLCQSCSDSKTATESQRGRARR